MIKYEIKPSVKLIYKTVKENIIYGDNPILAYILFEDYNYTLQEILKSTKWSKGSLSRDLQVGRLQIKNPVKQLHRTLYLEKIDEKFQIYTWGINKEVLTLQSKL